MRAVDSQWVSPMEAITAPRLGRSMATMKMPSSRCGSAAMVSTTRMRIRSTRPPSVPATAPTTPPMTVATSAATAPTSSETRRP